MAYKSPIEVTYNELKTGFDDMVMRAVQEVHISVNRFELLKALRYDRSQYEQGYADGLKDAIPIEWIKQYGEQNWFDYGTHHNAITCMLKAWEERKG